MPSRDQAERSYAEFIDLFVSDFSQDVAIYRDILAKFSGAALEAGCATGRVLARLAEAGHEVHGIETSRPMLEIARERIRPYRDRARAVYHDLRASALAQGFHAVLVTLYSFNALIDIEEHRRFLRHARKSLRSPGVIALDCFCPLSLVRPEIEGEWREIEREVAGRRLHVRDRREMLTPLLERRTQICRVDARPPCEMVTHRRYVPPGALAQLLEEAGFEGIVCVQNYDLATAGPAEADLRPEGPFLLLGEC